MDNKSIKNKLVGESSTMFIYEDGTSSLESSFYDIKTSANNPLLKIKFGGLLTMLALDDVAGTTKFLEEYTQVLNSIDNETDINDMLNFLNQIAVVNEMSMGYAEALEDITKNHLSRKNENVTIKEEQSPSKTHSIELLDMEYDELLDKAMKSPEDFHKLAHKYKEKIDELYEERENASPSEKDEIDELIKKTEQKRIAIIAKAEKLDEIENQIALL